MRPESARLDTPEIRADITKRRAARESNASIARAYGVTREWIRTCCKRWGITAPPAPSAEDVAKAAELILHGASVAAAAEAIGTSERSLPRLLEKNGTPLPELRKQQKAHKNDGKVWGLWTAIDGGYIYEGPNKRWQLCRCACGVEKKVMVGNLLNGLSRGCGCRSKKDGPVGRVKMPWHCPSTNERAEHTYALSRRLGVNYLNLMRRLKRGEPYTDPASGDEWVPLHQEATPHRLGHRTKTTTEAGE